MMTQTKKKFSLKEFAMNYVIYILMISLIIVVAIINPKFISLRVFKDILMQSSCRLVMTMGCMFIMLSGGTDLASGRLMGLAAVITGSMLQNDSYSNPFWPGLPEKNIPIILVFIVACGFGIALGLISGFVTAYLRVPAFIATLGMQLVVFGANSIYYNKPPNNSQPIGGLRKDFTNFGTGSIFGIPYILIVAIICLVGCFFVHYYTRFGKNLYAMGGNAEAARISGINTSRLMVAVYAIAGFFYTLTGFMESARTGGATNQYGTGYEMDCISACVVGGCSVAGGVGGVPGVAIGVIIFTVIQYGMTFVGINPYWQNIVKGTIVVVAVALDVQKYAKKR